MWNRAFMRLLSLSFTAFFVVALLWRERRPRGATEKGKQPEGNDERAAAPPRKPAGG